MRARRPDYFLVFPGTSATASSSARRSISRNGGKLIFPLPEIEIVGS